jgi:hypothetical protein
VETYDQRLVTAWVFVSARLAKLRQEVVPTEKYMRKLREGASDNYLDPLYQVSRYPPWPSQAPCSCRAAGARGRCAVATRSRGAYHLCARCGRSVYTVAYWFDWAQLRSASLLSVDASCMGG